MASMVEKLQLVVDATTGAAEARFGALTDRARETGDASVRAASTVESAADRVATAQAKQADEAGKLRVAQQRLTDLQEKGGASATQLAAAEEKVATGQRRLHLASREVAQATEAQTKAQQQAEAQAEETGQAQGQLAGHMDDLRGKLQGLVAGGAVVGYLKSVTAGFLDGARGAATLATSMNATTEQAGTLSQLLTSVGLDAADVLEIQAEFAQKIEANSGALAEFGAEVKRNEDGTTNWALTLEDALINLQKIPDATERNRRGFALFGEEGYKQLSRLLNSGMAVEDALEAIGTPFSDEDIAATREYDAAMMRLQLTTGDLGRSIGREVVPILAAVVDVFGDVASVVTAIPGPIALTTAAAIALGVTGFNPAALAGARLAAAMAVIRTEVGMVSAAMITGGAAGGALGAGLNVAATGAGRLGAMTAGALGGPLGIGLIAAGSAFYFAKGGADALEASAADAAAELANTEQGSREAARAADDLGRQLDREAGYWERVAALRRGATEALNESTAGPGDLLGFGAMLGGLKEGDVAAASFTEAIEKTREELGEYAAQAAASEAATFTLNELIAQGKTSGEEYAEAVRLAAENQQRQAETAGQAEAAIAALRAVTDLAYLSQLNLINAELGARDATYGFLDAMDEANAAVDDQETSVDEVAQAHDRLQSAALNAAGAAADAAVAAATANGTVLTELAEAQIRADAVIADLQARLNTPGLGDRARAEIQGIIDRLTEAKDNGSIEATLQALGVGEAAGQIDEATEDRETIVQVESRGGPAVDSYLERLTTRDRLAIVRVESRGGPDVDGYLERVRGKDRLAIVRVESRGGPAVDSYLDGLAAQDRLAIIRVESRGGPAVDAYLDGLAAPRTAVINVRRNEVGGGAAGPTGAPSVFGAPAVAGFTGPRVMVASVALDLQLTGTADRAQLSKSEQGRAYVEGIRAYERDNGTGWRKGS